MEGPWVCRRCGEVVDMVAKRCKCAESPSPWEPLAGRFLVMGDVLKAGDIIMRASGRNTVVSASAGQKIEWLQGVSYFRPETYSERKAQEPKRWTESDVVAGRVPLPEGIPGRLLKPGEYLEDGDLFFSTAGLEQGWGPSMPDTMDIPLGHSNAKFFFRPERPGEALELLCQRDPKVRGMMLGRAEKALAATEVVAEYKQQLRDPGVPDGMKGRKLGVGESIFAGDLVWSVIGQRWVQAIRCDQVVVSEQMHVFRPEVLVAAAEEVAAIESGFDCEAPIPGTEECRGEDFPAATPAGLFNRLSCEKCGAALLLEQSDYCSACFEEIAKGPQPGKESLLGTFVNQAPSMGEVMQAVALEPAARWMPNNMATPLDVEKGRVKCAVCNWTNTGLLNVGDPGHARWVCHGCIKRTFDRNLTPLYDSNPIGEFRRKPYAVQAIQAGLVMLHLKENPALAPAWIRELHESGRLSLDTSVVYRTEMCEKWLAPNSWIVKGPNGIETLEAEEFERTYSRITAVPLSSLHQNFDALDWAKEFVKIATERAAEIAKEKQYRHEAIGLRDFITEDLMLTWFANAIMCGHDEAMRRVQREKETEATLDQRAEKTREIVKRANLCAAHVGQTQVECPVCRAERLAEHLARTKRRRAWVFGKVCVTTGTQGANAPLIDACTTQCDGRSFAGVMIRLEPWKREHGQSAPQRGLVLAWEKGDMGKIHDWLSRWRNSSRHDADCFFIPFFVALLGCSMVFGVVKTIQWIIGQ